MSPDLSGFDADLLADTARMAREAHDLILAEGWRKGPDSMRIASDGLCIGAALAKAADMRVGNEWSYAMVSDPAGRGGVCPQGHVVRAVAITEHDLPKVCGSTPLWAWNDAQDFEGPVLDLLLSVEKHCLDEIGARP